MRNLKRLLLNNLLVSLIAAVASADTMSGGAYTIIKDLAGASGNALAASSSYTLAYAWGEPVSGDVISQSTYSITSGYFGGGFGTGLALSVVSTQIGAPGDPVFYQNQIQVGLPFDAPVQAVFSDVLDSSTISSGIQAVLLTDHLGLPSNTNVPITTRYDPVNRVVTILPQGAWTGNTFYDIQLTQALLSVDGFPLNQIYHIYFVTRLDPHEENVVLQPVAPKAGSQGVGGSASPMSIQIPTDSLSDYATVLTSQDPLNAPLKANHQIIQEANAKAIAAGGSYRAPVSIQEVIAYDTKGNLMQSLSTPAEISIHYDITNSPNLIRPQTLALWVLDTTHQLWVKIPESQNTSQMVVAPVTQFSVFALMGSPDGSASDSFAFPVPWRPHGPNAGSGSGQSGTEADGITFSNIPSECTIKIYTIAGDLVREIHHSDTGGLIAQEKWDVKTTHGDPAASGVYLWRVESSVDGKNGKLMVIR
jgi:hypothetical protein